MTTLPTGPFPDPQPVPPHGPNAASFYEIADGRLTGEQFSGPIGSVGIFNVPTGIAALAGHWDAALYRVIDGAAIARDACPISSLAVGLIVTLNGVPIGATVRVSGTASAAIVQDDASGALELTLPAHGAYAIACDCFPAIDYAESFSL